MVNFEKPVPRKVPNIELLRLANYTNSFINENKELATIVETLFQRFFRLLKKLEVPSGFKLLYPPRRTDFCLMVWNKKSVWKNFKRFSWRSRADLNRCTKFCRLLPNHSATGPFLLFTESIAVPRGDKLLPNQSATGPFFRSAIIVKKEIIIP